MIPGWLDTDNKTMFVASNIGRDTVAFFRFDPEANKLGEMIYGDGFDYGEFRPTRGRGRTLRLQRT